MSQYWPEDYRKGLANIKVAIEVALASAGASMSSSSVFLPRRKFQSSSVPRSMDIAAVPFDAPKILVEFTQQEILDCREGVKRADVREKIRRYSVSYARYREGPERVLRAFSPGQATGRAKPGLDDSDAG